MQRRGIRINARERLVGAYPETVMILVPSRCKLPWLHRKIQRLLGASTVSSRLLETAVTSPKKKWPSFPPAQLFIFSLFYWGFLVDPKPFVSKAGIELLQLVRGGLSFVVGAQDVPGSFFPRRVAVVLEVDTTPTHTRPRTSSWAHTHTPLLTTRPQLSCHCSSPSPNATTQCQTKTKTTEAIPCQTKTKRPKQHENQNNRLNSMPNDTNTNTNI